MEYIMKRKKIYSLWVILLSCSVAQAQAGDEFHWPLFLSAITGNGSHGISIEEINGINAPEISGAVVVGLQNIVASDSTSSLLAGGGSYQTKSSISPDFQICTTGSASVTLDDSGTSGTVDYKECTIGYGDYNVTFDGAVTFRITESTFIYTFDSVTVTSNFNLSASISGDLSCTFSAGADYHCSYSFNTSYAGIDYSIDNTAISGDPAGGYTVSYEMSSSTYGTISVATTSPITFNCSNGHPDSGSVIFTGVNGSSGSVTFDSCTSYTLTVDGVSNSYTW
jgi:hypothetical protein